MAALLRVGWRIKRESGSHRTLARSGWSDVVFAFHDEEEIGPRMLARIAKQRCPPYLTIAARLRAASQRLALRKYSSLRETRHVAGSLGERYSIGRR